MVDLDAMKITTVPSLATASVATMGYMGWLKFRRGVRVNPREILLQFSFSFAASLFVGYKLLQSKKRSREAFHRMMKSTEGATHVQYFGSGADKIPVQEYDAVTGVNGEEETRKAFALVEKIDSR